MTDIIYSKNNTTSLINISDNIIDGYTVTKDGIEPIHDNIVKIINSIRLGNNYIKLKSNTDYSVYKDLDSGFVHFFKDGKENIELFIEFNTSPSITYRFKDLTEKEKLVHRVLLSIEAGLLICTISTIDKLNLEEIIQYILKLVLI